MQLLQDKFQFHKGTIRTEQDGCMLQHLTAFQFHKGTIRTLHLLHLLLVFLHFNSIKVRLEPTTLPKVEGRNEFQFHKGTIRTSHKFNRYMPFVEFQFHKGTIRTSRQSPSLSKTRISIP